MASIYHSTDDATTATTPTVVYDSREWIDVSVSPRPAPPAPPAPEWEKEGPPDGPGLLRAALAESVEELAEGHGRRARHESQHRRFRPPPAEWLAVRRRSGAKG